MSVSASPRGASSESLALAGKFLDSHLQAHPDVVVDALDLFDGKLPAFGRLAAEAKIAVFSGGQPSAEQQGEWDAARAVFDRFAAADAYLFSVPMWNSGAPLAYGADFHSTYFNDWLRMARLHRRYRGPLAARHAHRHSRSRQGRRPSARRRGRQPLLTSSGP